MKPALRSFIGLFLLSSTVQAVPSPTDSLKAKQLLMIKRLDSLSSGFKKLSSVNDSLNKELYYYRAKDDFYVMAVDRQGSHFEWLLGIVVTVAGLFSYAFFWKELGKLRVEIITKVKGLVDNQVNELDLKTTVISNDYRKLKLDVSLYMSLLINNTLRSNIATEGNIMGIDIQFEMGMQSLHFAKDAYFIIRNNPDAFPEKTNSAYNRLHHALDLIRDTLITLKTAYEKNTDKNSVKDSRKYFREKYSELPNILDRLIEMNDSYLINTTTILKGLYQQILLMNS